MKNLTATQLTEVAKQFALLQNDHATVNPSYLGLMTLEADESGDTNKARIAHEVEQRAAKWSDDAKARYAKCESAVKAIQAANNGAYLFDECIDRENVLGGGMPEDAIGFWPAMVSSMRNAVYDRAEELGIDVTEALS